MSWILHFNRLAEWRALSPPEDRLRRAALRAIERSDREPTGEVSVTFLPESEIRALHREYLGADVSTDVIAFDLSDGDALLGDIYISPEVARRSAARLAVPVREEILRLVVHGFLHLLEHDHPQGEERSDSAMFRLQEEIVRALHDEEESGGP